MENKGCEQKDASGQNHKYGIKLFDPKTHFIIIIFSTNGKQNFIAAREGGRG